MPVPVNKLPIKVREKLAVLSPLSQRFVAYYCGLARGNGALAAEMAGVQTGQRGGSSHKVVLRSRASQMKSDPDVQAAIEAWLEAFALSKAEVTAGIADLASITPEPFFVLENGLLRLRDDLDEETWQTHAHWIKSFRIDEASGRVTEIQFHDRHTALRDLAKILGIMAPDNVNLHLHKHYRDMSDEELLKTLQEENAVVEAESVIVGTLPKKGGK